MLAFGKDLALKPQLHQIEDGPAIDATIDFLPGETVYMSFRVAGFESKEKDDEFQTVALEYRITVEDPEGVPAAAPQQGKFTTDLRREDKEWEPKIRREIRLPDHAIRGKYKVTLWVKDTISGEEATSLLSFPVRNRNVEGAPELTVRNFGFYRSEEDRRPLTQLIYHKGDSVFVRMDVTGYDRSGAKNAFDVEYGLKLTGPDGKPVVEQAQAAREAGEGFYPRRWLPVAFRLDLPPDPLKGPYDLTVEIRDKRSGKNLELRRNFEVE
ncbi:hypothetical protein F183_A41290 [Bryobacterales bacterium F-183]|nr:hypothetical protein F183_A41290 [Bryobacterales bacterium F-183]